MSWIFQQIIREKKGGKTLHPWRNCTIYWSLGGNATQYEKKSIIPTVPKFWSRDPLQVQLLPALTGNPLPHNRVLHIMNAAEAAALTTKKGKSVHTQTHVSVWVQIECDFILKIQAKHKQTVLLKNAPYYISNIDNKRSFCVCLEKPEDLEVTLFSAP